MNSKIDLGVAITTLNNFAFYKSYVKLDDVEFYYIFISFINSLFKCNDINLKITPEQIKTIDYIIKLHSQHIIKCIQHTDTITKYIDEINNYISNPTMLVST